jgi:hypothetical protein
MALHHVSQLDHSLRPVRLLTHLASEGVCTIGVGIIACFIMPEFPHNARMLKPIERDLAVWRLEAESGATEASDDIGTWKAFKLAMADKKLWLIRCGGMGQTMGSVFNFFP